MVDAACTRAPGRTRSSSADTSGRSAVLRPRRRRRRRMGVRSAHRPGHRRHRPLQARTQGRPGGRACMLRAHLPRAVRASARRPVRTRLPDGQPLPAAGHRALRGSVDDFRNVRNRRGLSVLPLRLPWAELVLLGSQRLGRTGPRGAWGTGQTRTLRLTLCELRWRRSAGRCGHRGHGAKLRWR